MVYQQIKTLAKDIPISTAKTGMLCNAGIIKKVASAIEDFKISKLVVDPVMISTSGYRLLSKYSLRTFKKKLLPLTYILTPNLYEAEILSKMKINDIDDMQKAARKILASGPSYVLIKGGHLASSFEAIDILYDGKKIHKVESPRIHGKKLHGCGCSYSAAIAAYLAKNYSTLLAVKKAKKFIHHAIKNAYKIGKDGIILNQLEYFLE